MHVLAILVWVGGDVTLTTLGIVFERRARRTALAELGKMGAWIGTRVYTPALFVALAFGVAMMRRATGLVGRVLDRLRARRLGHSGGRRRRLRRARARAASMRPLSSSVPIRPRCVRRVQRLFLVFRFDTALLMLIAVDMVAKPSF